MDYEHNRYIQGLNRAREEEPARDKGPNAILTVAIGIGSFAAGFALIYLIYRPAPLAEDLPPVEMVFDAGVDEDWGAPAPAETDPSADLDLEAEALPEVPPGRTPQGVWIDGTPKYLKCWDPTGAEQKGESCDTLRLLEKRFATRLYVVDRCKRSHAGAESEGELSLGVQVDVKERTIRFWSGPSSTLENATQIGICVRQGLEGLPIHSIDHKYERYRLFFTVEFNDPEKLKKKIEKKKRRGKPMEVIKKRVRVRKAPVDGEVIGNVNTGNPVTLLKKKDDWCHVITPNLREGWMICDALSVPGKIQESTPPTGDPPEGNR
jgi:hypothetical protein